MKILDHGFVRLVDWMGSDLSIVRAARVSHNAAWRAGKDAGSDERLINFLYHNGHNTPFEAVVVQLEVKLPIFVARQWVRHRTQSLNEVSARYTQLPEEFYVPSVALVGQQSERNKQAREMLELKAEVMVSRREEVADIVSHHRASYRLYKSLLAAGWPRELARTVLPTAIYTHFFTTLNLWNLFRFLSERAAWDAQYEIRVYAEAIVDLVRSIAPVAVEAWHKHAFRWVPTDQIRWVGANGTVAPIPLHLEQRWDQPITTLTEWREVTLQPMRPALVSV